MWRTQSRDNEWYYKLLVESGYVQKHREHVHYGTYIEVDDYKSEHFSITCFRVRAIIPTSIKLQTAFQRVMSSLERPLVKVFKRF